MIWGWRLIVCYFAVFVFIVDAHFPPLGPFKFVLLHDRGTSGLVSIGPPNPALNPAEVLPLPDLDHGLAPLERLLARPPRRVPMRSRHGDQDAFLPDRDVTQAVRHGDGRERVLVLGGARDGHHRFQRQRWIRRVFQPRDALALGVVSRGSCVISVRNAGVGLGGAFGDKTPAKRRFAPAAGFLTLVRVDEMSSGQCVSETDIPSAVSCWGSAGWDSMTAWFGGGVSCVNQMGCRRNGWNTLLERG